MTKGLGPEHMNPSTSKRRLLGVVFSALLASIGAQSPLPAQNVKLTDAGQITGLFAPLDEAFEASANANMILRFIDEKVSLDAAGKKRFHTITKGSFWAVQGTSAVDMVTEAVDVEPGAPAM